MCMCVCVCVDWTNAISKESRNAIYLHLFTCWNKEFQSNECFLGETQHCVERAFCVISLKARYEYPDQSQTSNDPTCHMFTPNQLWENSIEKVVDFPAPQTVGSAKGPLERLPCRAWWTGNSATNKDSPRVKEWVYLQRWSWRIHSITSSHLTGVLSFIPVLVS